MKHEFKLNIGGKEYTFGQTISKHDFDEIYNYYVAHSKECKRDSHGVLPMEGFIPDVAVVDTVTASDGSVTAYNGVIKGIKVVDPETGEVVTYAGFVYPSDTRRTSRTFGVVESIVVDDSKGEAVISIRKDISPVGGAAGTRFETRQYKVVSIELANAFKDLQNKTNTRDEINTRIEGELGADGKVVKHGIKTVEAAVREYEGLVSDLHDDTLTQGGKFAVGEATGAEVAAKTDEYVSLVGAEIPKKELEVEEAKHALEIETDATAKATLQADYDNKVAELGVLKGRIASLQAELQELGGNYEMAAAEVSAEAEYVKTLIEIKTNIIDKKLAAAQPLEGPAQTARDTAATTCARKLGEWNNAKTTLTTEQQKLHDIQNPVGAAPLADDAPTVVAQRAVVDAAIIAEQAAHAAYDAADSDLKAKQKAFDDIQARISYYTRRSNELQQEIDECSKPVDGRFDLAKAKAAQEEAALEELTKPGHARFDAVQNKEAEVRGLVVDGLTNVAGGYLDEKDAAKKATYFADLIAAQKLTDAEKAVVLAQEAYEAKKDSTLQKAETYVEATTVSPRHHAEVLWLEGDKPVYHFFTTKVNGGKVGTFIIAKSDDADPAPKTYFVEGKTEADILRAVPENPDELIGSVGARPVAEIFLPNASDPNRDVNATVAVYKDSTKGVDGKYVNKDVDMIQIDSYSDFIDMLNGKGSERGLLKVYEEDYGCGSTSARVTHLIHAETDAEYAARAAGSYEASLTARGCKLKEVELANGTKSTILLVPQSNGTNKAYYIPKTNAAFIAEGKPVAAVIADPATREIQRNWLPLFKANAPVLRFVKKAGATEKKVELAKGKAGYEAARNLFKNENVQVKGSLKHGEKGLFVKLATVSKKLIAGVSALIIIAGGVAAGTTILIKENINKNDENAALVSENEANTRKAVLDSLVEKMNNNAAKVGADAFKTTDTTVVKTNDGKAYWTVNTAAPVVNGESYVDTTWMTKLEDGTKTITLTPDDVDYLVSKGFAPQANADMGYGFEVGKDAYNKVVNYKTDGMSDPFTVSVFNYETSTFVTNYSSIESLVSAYSSEDLQGAIEDGFNKAVLEHAPEDATAEAAGYDNGVVTDEELIKLGYEHANNFTGNYGCYEDQDIWIKQTWSNNGNTLQQITINKSVAVPEYITSPFCTYTGNGFIDRELMASMLLNSAYSKEFGSIPYEEVDYERMDTDYEITLAAPTNDHTTNLGGEGK
ncbi:MAG: hypothetical protein IJ817_03720 [Clostridia bacterium]|nr:hypothetical protein [Clostridia bacterium]